MSVKKYQIFISSTYIDLLEERQTAVNAILDAGHIPTGMELFAAEDRGQWAVITDWIDECDIYMLILGGRYGSIESKSQKSYTHLEFEYAIEKKKPFFALELSPDAIKRKKDGPMGDNAIEQNDTKSLKLFREAVQQQMIKRVDDLKDITLQTRRSIDALEKKHSMDGWVPGASVIRSNDDAKKYGIRITSPREGDVINRCDFHGSIERPLPDGYEIRLTRVWPNLKGYFPLGGRVEIDMTNKSWVARDCYIGGNPNDLRIIHACIMNSASAALSDYQREATAFHWPFVEEMRKRLKDPLAGSPLPAIQYQGGTLICHTINVRRDNT